MLFCCLFSYSLAKKFHSPFSILVSSHRATSRSTVLFRDTLCIYIINIQNVQTSNILNIVTLLLETFRSPRGGRRQGDKQQSDVQHQPRSAILVRHRRDFRPGVHQGATRPRSGGERRGHFHPGNYREGGIERRSCAVRYHRGHHYPNGRERRDAQVP